MRQRLFADYGMVLVLLLLCGFFSIVTTEEQAATGAAAARQVAAALAADFGAAPRVLVVAGDQPGGAAFADRLEQDLAKTGARVVQRVGGGPAEARAALGAIAAGGDGLDAIACTQPAASWLVFSDLTHDFPALGRPRLVVPVGYRWPNFLKAENLINVANQITVIAIVAVGMTIVIITGGIDLSVGSLLALSAVVATAIIRDLLGGPQATAGGMLLASLAAVALCAAVGGFSGGMVTGCGIPPFIVTLAMMLVASGLASILAQGQSIYQVPDSFTWLGRGADLFGLPNAVLLMLLLYGLAHVLMTRTTLGRYLYAVGGNREAARLSGVPVNRVICFAYVVSGLLAGVGGVVMASQLKSGSPTYGAMYELYVIAAVVVGGTSLRGGEGSMLGTLVGAFIIAVIQNGLNLTNVESYTQKVVLGLVILGAVLLDRIRHR